MLLRASWKISVSLDTKKKRRFLFEEQYGTKNWSNFESGIGKFKTFSLHESFVITSVSRTFIIRAKMCVFYLSYFSSLILKHSSKFKTQIFTHKQV